MIAEKINKCQGDLNDVTSSVTNSLRMAFFQETGLIADPVNSALCRRFSPCTNSQVNPFVDEIV